MLSCVEGEVQQCQKTPHPGKTMTEEYFNRQMGVLEKERVAQLNVNGILWNLKTSDENKNFCDALFPELLSYLQTYGDCNIPQYYPCNPLLVRWVSLQCNDYDLKWCHGEQTSLTPLCKAKLDAIGFTWFVARGNTLKMSLRDI
jgi:hypothetical protein